MDAQDTSNKNIKLDGWGNPVGKQTIEQEQLMYIRSIKNNVQFFAWLIIIGFVISIIMALLGL